MSVKAQNTFTLNTRAWTTNYWTMLIYDAAHGFLSYGLYGTNDNSKAFDVLIPYSDLVFPIGIEKEGFENNNIYGPYHRAFGNPFKHPGDFGVGLDASFKHGRIGIYGGAYFKSQEICFKANDNNLRALYFQPRAGLIIGGDDPLELGVYYDMVVGSAGNYPNVNNDMFTSGFGLDITWSLSIFDNKKSMITFMLPLHNFINEKYSGGDFVGMKRKVGYLMFTHRIVL